jgi:hypothetical protein
MTNVFQATSLPLNGSTIALGPVTISAKYPPKATSRGTMMRNIKATDNSGSIDITLFGAAANLPWVDGSTVTIKGALKRGEYNGNPKLQGESGLTIENADGSAQAQAPQSGGGVSQPKQDRLNDKELAFRMAEFTVEYKNNLIQMGESEEFASSAAIYAPQFAAQWFQGEKYPTRSTDEDTPY